MKENGDFVKEPKDVAQLPNKFFVDIGKNMAKAIAPIHSTYKPPRYTYSKNSLFMSHKLRRNSKCNNFIK